jgi:hypothetical protein
LYGDGLLFELNNYLYNQNPVTTTQNLKKMGVTYLLTDLNAATIDKDARHNLTTRYEKLLTTFLSPDLELVETDSMCLKVALEKFRNDQNFADYMVLAGVNYESYQKDAAGNEKVTNRGQKLTACYQFMYTLIKDKQVDENHYPFLMPVVNYLNNNKASLDSENKIYEFLHSQFGNSFKALFKIVK